MSVLGPDVAAAVFDDTDTADEAWSLLVDADIPATVIVDPGMLGAYTASVMVERARLEEAQRILAPFVNAQRGGA